MGRLAHIDVDMRVVQRRGHANTLEFPYPDADFRCAAIIPELRKTAEGRAPFGIAVESSMPSIICAGPSLEPDNVIG